MADMHTIYDPAGKIIGICRFGVVWRREPRERLGEYHDGVIYDARGAVLATFDGLQIWDLRKQVLGEIRASEMLMGGRCVGRFIGSALAGAAAAVLLSRSHTSDNS